MKELDIKIGLPVTYYKIIKLDGTKLIPVKTVIKSEAWQLGHGEWVCKLEGISGGVAISHLEERTIADIINN